MNTAQTLATALLVASIASTANSQSAPTGEFRQFANVEAYRCCELGRIEDAYVRSLQHSNLGVVESAISNVARFMIARPECFSSAIDDQVRALAVDGPTAAIRYKASLTSLVCDRPELFLDLKDIDFTNSEELFTTIAQRLKERTLLLVSR